MTLAKRNSATKTQPNSVASKVMETTPVIMRFIRAKMKERSNTYTKTHTSVPQIRVMAFIERHPGCSLTAVSEFLGITSASASTMIERLVKSGLVDRVVDPLKRRNVILHLTAPGQEELGGARHLAVAALSDQLAKLNETQLKHMEESMILLKAIFGTVYGDLDAPGEHAFSIEDASADSEKRIRGTV
jgi:DNA-binding MarR family transcriptional regulator